MEGKLTESHAKVVNELTKGRCELEEQQRLSLAAAAAHRREIASEKRMIIHRKLSIMEAL